MLIGHKSKHIGEGGGGVTRCCCMVMFPTKEGGIQVLAGLAPYNQTIESLKLLNFWKAGQEILGIKWVW